MKLWFQASEGAKFWLAVLNELKQRGVQDVLICCVDGLNGFPEVIEAVFPQTWVQTCIVHLIRHSGCPRQAPAQGRAGPEVDLHPPSTPTPPPEQEARSGQIRTHTWSTAPS